VPQLEYLIISLYLASLKLLKLPFATLYPGYQKSNHSHIHRSFDLLVLLLNSLINLERKCPISVTVLPGKQEHSRQHHHPLLTYYFNLVLNHTTTTSSIWYRFNEDSKLRRERALLLILT
jgi:hypothetical protein